MSQTSADLGGTLNYDTLADQNSLVGTYSVTPKGLTSSNYAVSFVAGTLTVTAADTNTALSSDKSTGSTYGDSVTWTATVTSQVTSGEIGRASCRERV